MTTFYVMKKAKYETSLFLKCYPTSACADVSGIIKVMLVSAVECWLTQQKLVCLYCCCHLEIT